MARVRGGTGLITVEMASPEQAGRHRRRELGIYDDRFLPGLTRLVAAIHAGGAKASIQLGHGGGHTRVDICGETPVAPSAIPHPVYETTFETIIPRGDDQSAHRRNVAAFRRRGGARRTRRLRLRRDPCRAWLSDLAIPHAVRESPHRRVWRQPREPRALRPRGAARGEGRGARHRRDLPALGRGLFSRRHAVSRRPAGRDLGGAKRAPTRSISPPAITARCPRRAASSRRWNIPTGRFSIMPPG